MAASDIPQLAPFKEDDDSSPEQNTTTWYSEDSDASSAASSSQDATAASSSRKVHRPVDSDRKFEEMGLNELLLKGIFDSAFERPSRIQAQSIPKILAAPKTHLIAEAQSGSGKTLAFAIPTLQRVDGSKAQPQAVFILPTRELATQVYEVTAKIGRFLPGVSVQLCVSEKDVKASSAQVKIPSPITAQILVGTPGKIEEVLRVPKFVRSPGNVRILVIDEADQMITDDKSKSDSFQKQLEKIRAKVAADCQVLLFSATFPENVTVFTRDFLRGQPHDSIRIEPEKRVVQAIQQLYIRCGDTADKIRVLADIYKTLTIPQSMIFVRTQKAATYLREQMTKAGFTVSEISGGLKGHERDQVFRDFKEGRTKVLISTNVLARGIDVRTVTLIINFDLPTSDPEGKVADVDTYFHRVGRTGRFGDEGLAINLVANEQDMGFVRKFEAQQFKQITEFERSKIPDLQAILDEISEANAGTA